MYNHIEKLTYWFIGYRDAITCSKEDIFFMDWT